MELTETVGMMMSSDYKERFKAEYAQLSTRFMKLQNMIVDWDNNVLRFTPTCPRGIYSLQLRGMGDYLAVLEARAAIEGIDLTGLKADPNI